MIRFEIKGSCVDDLFHILAANGYKVQLSTTNEKDVFIVDVIFKNESEDK